MIDSRWARPMLILCSIAALAGAVAGGGVSPVRTALAVWVMVVCPGLALVGLIKLRDVWTEIGLVLALSAAVDVIVAGAFTYAGGWSPNATLAIVLSISFVGAAIQARHESRGLKRR